MRFLLLVLAIAGTLGVFATTRSGHALLKRLGFRRYVPGSAPARDVEYRRSLCGGDPAEADERLEAERSRYPALGEAEHYRHAIRRALVARDGAGPRLERDALDSHCERELTR